MAVSVQNESFTKIRVDETAAASTELQGHKIGSD
jgi:hypothetical protein